MRHRPFSSGPIPALLVAIAISGCATTTTKHVAAGDNADSVLRVVGRPDFWGNLDDENRPDGQFSLNVSWQFEAGLEPDKLPDRMAWVYWEHQNAPGGKATIVMFNDSRVTQVAKAKSVDIYDP